MDTIHFHAEDIAFEHSQSAVIKEWLTSVAKQENNDISTVSFIFCSDEYLHKINVEYLNHDDLTDVITFQYSEPNSGKIEGDIFISTERIAENAKTYDVDFYHELHRVIVHGTLHLLGYGDKSPEDKKQMTEKENFYLKQLNVTVN